MSSTKKALGWPVRRVLDPRVEWIMAHMDERLGAAGGARPPVHDRLDRLEVMEAQMREHLGLVQERVETVERVAGQVVGQVSTVLGRLDQENRAQSEAQAAILEGNRALNELLSGFEPDYQLPPLDRRSLGDLRWAVAEFLNWAAGPNGYAAQVGLWVNAPVLISHSAGEVRVENVNERIVENAWVMSTVGAAPGRRIIDVGGSESTVALSLASLGNDVTVVDPRGYGFRHPSLRLLDVRLDEVGVPDDPYDAAVVLSAVEHFGLGSYDVPEASGREDLAAMRHLLDLVAPGGVLALTVPMGEPSTDDFQRVYDAAGVRELVEGWEVTSFEAVWKHDRTTWLPGPVDEAAGPVGVGLLAAVRPATPGH
jgi:hypothetical protein